MSTDIFAPHCGCFEHIVFSATLKGAEDAVCVCLEPGQYYGFHIGAAGKPIEVSFSIDGLKVRGAFDWEWIDGANWTFLSVTYERTTYTVWVSQPVSEGDFPLGRLEIKGETVITHELEPATIIHDLPFR